ncbi:hypothetical protein [Pseudomonas plecoglossicida]|uniref:hypothetical protein n=1 Tax=Pseudomonas plecoglossicida TaxID=70775 RepID=UPI001160CEFD|nr:hypothetical protein [Pseudomonas plecoglossicida]
MLFLKMGSFLGISKLAGSHIDMGIQWNSYISAATTKLSRLVFSDPKVELGTTPVSAERMQAASLLEYLSFDSTRPVIIGDRGLLVPLCANNERYVVLYRFDRCDALVQRMTESCRERDVDACEYVDAFFFFLVKEFDIPLPSSVTKDGVGGRIINGKKGPLLDFDDVVNFHGSFLAWKIGESTSSSDLVDLLTWQVGELHCIGFTDDNPAYGIDRIESFMPGIKVLDLRKLCRAVVSPIAIATDKKSIRHLNRPWFSRHSPSSGNSVSHTLLETAA